MLNYKNLPIILTKVFPICLCLLSGATARAQFTNHFRASKMHSSSSHELTRFLKDQLNKEASEMNTLKNSFKIATINAKRKSAILKMVRSEAFMDDDSLEAYVNNVLAHIATRNALAPEGRRALVLRKTDINALCYGDGIYILTLGMVANVADEDELAFVLAHEMAHDVLRHIQSKIILNADINLEAQAKKQITIDGKVDIEGVEEFRELVYDVMRYSRKNELQADSLGLRLMANAGYDPSKAFSLLSTLDYSLSVKHVMTDGFFEPLDSPEYPFNGYWLKPPLAVYNKSFSSDFRMNLDSAKTHPDIPFRREELFYLPVDAVGTAVYQDKAFTAGVAEFAEFQLVEQSLKAGEYDVCLFYALMFLQRYPNDTYLISSIGKLLVDLAYLRSEAGKGMFVEKFTLNYSKQMQLVNNLLRNIETKELQEMTFHFFADQNHFDAENKNHYLLLNKICELTYRRDAARDVAKQFKTKFGSGLNGYVYK